MRIPPQKLQPTDPQQKTDRAGNKGIRHIKWTKETIPNTFKS